MASSFQQIEQLLRSTDHASGVKEERNLSNFYKNVAPGEKVLVVIGKGTAALTYLYTADIEQYKHILILGERGYWNKSAHRLAQPHHILALPHTQSDEFVDPAKHDEQHGILPHLPHSAYVHSKDYQKRLVKLEEATMAKLKRQGKHVLLTSDANVNSISRLDASHFGVQIKNEDKTLVADKVVVATGAGPARKLPQELLAAIQDKSWAHQRIMDYNDILHPQRSKQCFNKTVLIYGGGATAAWAMEVADLNAKPVAWVAKSGFGEAEIAGPRVGAIIDRTRQLQMQGTITKISHVECPITKEPKMSIEVTCPKTKQTQTYMVDYLINCIGQEAYDVGGLPKIISPELQKELSPVLDKNAVSGKVCKLGWGTEKGDLTIIGAAQGTYYKRGEKFDDPGAVSQFLPRSGQVPITIGGVVSSVCALTNYMPIIQDPKTKKCKLLSLNLNVMNATQLAVYFTARFPNASPRTVNQAVTEFVSARSSTEFGLSNPEILKLLQRHFKDVKTIHLDGDEVSHVETPTPLFTKTIQHRPTTTIDLIKRGMERLATGLSATYHSFFKHEKQTLQLPNHHSHVAPAA